LTAAPVVKWYQDRARALTLAKGNQTLTEEVTEQAAEALEMMTGKDFEDTGTVAVSGIAFGSGDVLRRVGNRVELTLKSGAYPSSAEAPSTLPPRQSSPANGSALRGFSRGLRRLGSYTRIPVRATRSQKRGAWRNTELAPKSRAGLPAPGWSPVWSFLGRLLR
jgi:hypothetical protein